VWNIKNKLISKMNRGILIAAILFTFALPFHGVQAESCGNSSTRAHGLYYSRWDPNLGTFTAFVGDCESAGYGTASGPSTTVNDTTSGNLGWDLLFTFSLSALPSGCSIDSAAVVFHVPSAGESFQFSYLNPSNTLTLGEPVCPTSPSDVVSIPAGNYDATPELFEVDVAGAIQEAIAAGARMFQFQITIDTPEEVEAVLLKRSLLPQQVSMAPRLQIGTPSDAPPAGSSRKCARGESGPTGPDNCFGPTGKIGITGKTGQTGRTGLTAEDGKTGKTGVTHVTGKTGPTEEEGKVGKTGVTHITGKTGRTGVTGRTGRTGKTAQTGITIVK